MNQYVICYDIRNPKRLQKVHNHVKKYAIALGYSVFLFSGLSKEKDQLMRSLFTLIDKKLDDLRCYVIPSDLLKARFGKEVLPDGIMLSALPHKYI